MARREAMLAKVADWTARAAADGCGLVAFGEALAPGYPFWLEWTGGARFDSDLQKDQFAHYVDQAVTIEAGHLDEVCAAAARHGIAVVLGIVERPRDRSAIASIAAPWSSMRTAMSPRSTAS